MKKYLPQLVMTVLIIAFFNKDTNSIVVTSDQVNKAQASVNASNCISKEGYKSSQDGTVSTSTYAGKDITILYVPHKLPCGVAAYVHDNVITITKENGQINIPVVAHESYHWCRNNISLDPANDSQINEETMAYCVGDVTSIILTN